MTPTRLGSFTVAIMGAWLSAALLAQTPVTGTGTVPAQDSDGGQAVGSQGDPDPGVHFVVAVDNPQVASFSSAAGRGRRARTMTDVQHDGSVTGPLELRTAAADRDRSGSGLPSVEGPDTQLK